MHIGLIGGIGVAATVVYYQRLTAAVTAMGGRLQLTIAHAEVTDLARNANAGNTAEQADIYAGLIDRLARAGCDCAAITSLGGHFCFEDTVARSALPLVSAVAPLDDHFASRGVGTVGLLGTSVLMRSQLFGQLSLTRAIVPLALIGIGVASLGAAGLGLSPFDVWLSALDGLTPLSFGQSAWVTSGVLFLIATCFGVRPPRSTLSELAMISTPTPAR